MKYEIEKDFILEAHKSACSAWQKKIENQVPDLFETEYSDFTSGWLYCQKDLVMSVTGTVEAIEGKLYWAINNKEARRLNLHNESGNTNHEIGYYNQWFKIATKEQIENWMFGQAELRGFRQHIHVDRKNIEDEPEFNMSRFGCLSKDSATTRYIKERNLYMLYGTYIFCNGKWAEPVNIEYLDEKVK